MNNRLDICNVHSMLAVEPNLIANLHTCSSSLLARTTYRVAGYLGSDEVEDEMNYTGQRLCGTSLLLLALKYTTEATSRMAKHTCKCCLHTRTHM